MALYFIRVDPTEDQQMMVLGQVMQCPNDGVEPLVAAEKSENPDQSACGRDAIEHRKFFSRRGASDVRHLGGRQKRQRMVVYMPHAMREFHMPKVAAGVHDHGHRLEALGASKPAG